MNKFFGPSDPALEEVVNATGPLGFGLIISDVMDEQIKTLAMETLVYIRTRAGIPGWDAREYIEFLKKPTLYTHIPDWLSKDQPNDLQASLQDSLQQAIVRTFEQMFLTPPELPPSDPPMCRSRISEPSVESVLGITLNISPYVPAGMAFMESGGHFAVLDNLEAPDEGNS